MKGSESIMSKKQMNKKSKASLLPLAVGVGVGALYGVNVPLDGSGHNVLNITAKAAEATLELPKAGADYTKDAGDTTHYNIIRDGTTLVIHNGLQYSTTYIAPTNYKVKALTLFNGEYYGAVVGKYDTKIIKYDPATHLWNEQAVLDGPVYNLIKTDSGLVAGGGSAGTYGADFRLYSSEDGKNWSTQISGYRSFSSTTSSDIGFFYTGTNYKEGAVVFGGMGKWTFVRESQDLKTFPVKQEIYGTYTDSVSASGTVVAVGSQATTNDPYGSIAVSKDGGDYQVIKLGVGEVLSGVTYGNGKFVAVGESYYLGALTYTSTDGVNWTRTIVPTEKKILRDIEWDAKNERFVAVGDGGKMLVSKDGVSWVTLSVGTGNNISLISMKDNVPDDFDYAAFNLYNFWAEVRALSYKELKDGEIEAMKERFETLKTETYEKVTATNLLYNLNTGVIKYIQQDFDKISSYNVMYQDFLTFKEKTELMPSGTFEEKKAQIEAIQKYESEITATKYPAPMSNYITSFKNEVTTPYLREKQLAEAIAYVEKAEQTLRQTDYDAALKKVQALPYNSQSPLTSRLNAIIQPVKFQEAKVAIENYKNDGTTANENIAVTKINDLTYNDKVKAQEIYFYVRMDKFDVLLSDYIEKPSPEKTEMLRNFLSATPSPNNTTNAVKVEKGNKFRDAVDVYAREFLPKNFALADTKFKAEYYLNSNKVTNSMSYAETQKFSATITLLQQMYSQSFTVGLVEAVEANPSDSAAKTKATTYINNLSSSFSQLKTHLTNRLQNANVDRYQKESETLLDSLTKEYNAELVKQAEVSISLVKDATKKETFMNQLDAIKEKEAVRQATEAVTNVEATPSYDGVEKATALVEVVKNAETKSALENRLDAVVEELKIADILSDIVIFEESPTVDAYNELLESVKEVKNEEKRAELKTAIEDVWNTHLLAVATASTKKAEETLSKEDYAQAVEDINVLVSGEEKDDLTNRIQEVAYQIQVNEVKTLVSTLEKTLNREDIDATLEEVNKLRDGEVKDVLIERVAQVEQVILVEDAKVAVTKLEENPNQEDLNVIKKSLENIRDGFEKTALEERIEAVQQSIYEAQATELVNLATENLTQDNLNKAKEVIAKMADGDAKDELTTAIELLQDTLDAKPVESMLEAFRTKLEAITKRPKKPEAEALVTQYNYIIKAIDQLRESIVKDNLETEAASVKELLDAVLKNGNHPQTAPGQIKKASILEKVATWISSNVLGR